MKFIKKLDNPKTTRIPKVGDVRNRTKFLLFPKSVIKEDFKYTYWLCKVTLVEEYSEFVTIETTCDIFHYGWDIIDIKECK